MLERLGIVPVARRDQRPALQVAGVQSGRALQLLDESRIRPRRFEHQTKKRLLGRIGLGGRGEHARCHLRSAAAGLATLKHSDPQPFLRQAPARSEADHPATNDDHVKVRHTTMLVKVACQTCGVTDRRQRLASARLYLVCGDRPDEFLEAALRGGVDIVQLRMKDAPDDAIVAAAERFALHDVLVIVNDRADLAVAAGADGVHLGQDDLAVLEARAIVGPERLIGLSTHTPQQIDAAAGVDYIGVGPVYETPTKPGRPAVGLELVRHAARHARMPFFAIGGINADNADAVRSAGAERIAVVRAVADAHDPEAAARELIPAEVRLGAA